jgi:hypothetical protein
MKYGKIENNLSHVYASLKVKQLHALLQVKAGWKRLP